MLTALGLAALLGVSCGEDCTRLDCGSLTGDSSKAGSYLNLCKTPSKCDGCYYQKLVDETGKKLTECQDAADAKCDNFINRDAKDYCAMGAFCRRTGIACGPSGQASAQCCSGYCGTGGTCENR